MAPKSKKQFEAIRQESITAIKKAALELFATNGFAHTSIARIAKEAGISKGLMYNYFDSKEDLLRSVIADAIAVGNNIVDESLNESDDPADQFRKLIEVTFRSVRANVHYWKLITSLAFQQEILANNMDLIGEQNTKNIRLMVPILEKLGFADPEKEALMLGATLDGIMMGFLAMGEHYPVDEMKNHLIQHYTTRINQ